MLNKDAHSFLDLSAEIQLMQDVVQPAFQGEDTADLQCLIMIFVSEYLRADRI